VDFLVEKVKQFQHQDASLSAASISMGAALNDHTGEILNSGPLWGPDCQKFDLLGHLRKRKPDVNWVVVNDVSAALLRFANNPQYAQCRRINLITVSSGIACRTLDQSKSYIPVNKDGIQGEIGHIPIEFSLLNQPLTEICDCGGKNHLNAFSSGRGITKILHTFLSKSHPSSLFQKQLMAVRDNDHELTSTFFSLVKADDPTAIRILDAVTYPIAKMITHMLTIDAEIEKIIMTGGVVHAIEKHYMHSLLKNLGEIGLYQVSSPEAFFKKTLTLGINDDDSGLIGAAIAYDNKINSTI
jgi:glucokinase